MLLILLWITVMFNMLFADVFSIIIEIVDGNAMDIPFDVNTMMGIAAILTNIPILMILLTWVLPYKINRRVNIGAAIFTVVYIVGGGSWLPHYLIIGSIEIVLLITVIMISYRWRSN